jgi:hypothetical protein
MSTEEYVQRLVEANRLIAETEQRIAKQRERIVQQTMVGYDTTLSQGLLRQMEDELRLRIAYRALIIKEIGDG